MATWQAYSLYSIALPRADEPPVLVVGITHAQTAIVLEGRLRALVESGFRVVVISSAGDLLDRLARQEGVETIAIPMERNISPLRDLVSFVRICSALRRLRPVITEFSTPKAGLLGNLAAALCGVPKRVYLLRGLRLETATGIKRLILLCSERAAAACSHVVLCNSRSLLLRAQSIGICRAKKLELLGQGSGKGVDVERFAPTEPGCPSQPKSGSPSIGFVGRLTRDKGIPELIDAFDRLLLSYPMARLHLVGWYDDSDDALSVELRGKIDTHPAIVRTGFVADTAAYYRFFDMLVLPTYREGFPNVVLEAAASGLPVITTTATGARDAVEPGVTGLLVAPGDADALLRAMLALAAEPDRARRMGQAARTRVLRMFVDRHVQALMVGFYRGLCYAAQERTASATAKGEAAAGD